MLTTLLNYDEDSGWLSVSDGFTVPWLPSGVGEEYEGNFRHTARCLKEIGIELEDKSLIPDAHFLF